MHHQVRENLSFAGEAMKRHYDWGDWSTDYEVSGKVWLYNPRRRKGLLPKLQSPWEGLYTVVERVYEVTYCIRQGQRARPKVVRDDMLWRITALAPDSANFKIRQILRSPLTVPL